MHMVTVILLPNSSLRPRVAENKFFTDG